MWKAMHSPSRNDLEVTSEKQKVYEATKEEAFPLIQKEAKEGMKGFEQIKFQPVHSPGIFEAEFGVKKEDILFHFWPDGYHQAERDKKVTPRFPKIFGEKLLTIMSKVFDPIRIEIYEDKDVGAWFAKATGYGSGNFHRELAIKAVTELHTALGGES